MMPQEIIDEMLKNANPMPMQMGDHVRSIVKNAVEAGYAAGCEEAARIVESQGAMVRFSAREAIAKAIRDWCRQVIK